MAVAAATALLGPPAMESRDRLPVGILVGAILLLVVNAIWAMRRMADGIDVSTAASAWSGSPVDLEIDVHAGPGVQHEVALIAINGIFPVAVRPGVDGRLRVPSLPTGVYDHVIVEVTTSAPFGLVAVGRRCAVDLRRSLAVCPPPRPIDAEILTLVTAGAEVENDEIVGLRERRTGDQLRDLDWAATARTGRLIVRQRDRHSPGAIHLVVESETASMRPLNTALHTAHGLGRHLLAAGHELSLTMRDARTDGPDHRGSDDVDPDRSITGQFDHHGQTATHAVATPEHLAWLLASATPGPVRRPDGPHILCSPEAVSRS